MGEGANPNRSENKSYHKRTIVINSGAHGRILISMREGVKSGKSVLRFYLERTTL